MDARVEIGEGEAAGAMAIRAVGVKVGTNAEFLTDGGIFRARQSKERVRRLRFICEIAGRGESGDLVGRLRAVRDVAIHLGRVETKDQSGGGIVAGETFGATRVTPDLCADRPAVIDR